MRNCLVEINDEQYIPVRAIPFVTGNFIEPSRVPSFLAGNDIYFSAPSYILFEGKLELIPEHEWLGIGRVEKFDDLPTALIKMKDLKSVIFDVFQEPFLPNSSEDPIMHEAFKIPNTGSLLNDQNFKLVMAGINIATDLRKNGAEIKRKKIMSAVRVVEELCKTSGIRFSQDHIPGIKHQLHQCLLLINPSIAMELSTFGSKEYAKRLGLKWKQGETDKTGESMVKAVKDYCTDKVQ